MMMDIGTQIVMVRPESWNMTIATRRHQRQDEVARAQEENEEIIFSSEVQRSVAGGVRRFTDLRPITEVEMRKAKGFSGIDNPENQKETMYE
jgi:hypothetical protein